MSPLLHVRSVSRTFDDGTDEVVAVDEASFDVDGGELVAIMGASGSGKSTLLMMSGGLETPTAGSIVVDGTDLSDLSPVGLAELRRRRLGYVFQELNLLAGLTAVENVAIPLELDGLKASEAMAIAEERLAEVGLSHKTTAFPDDLSGGERQRVAIARALIGERRLLLADEPTGALDSATGGSIMRMLRAAAEAGAAVVVVTHDPSVAAAADRTLTMTDGRLEEPAP